MSYTHNFSTSTSTATAIDTTITTATNTRKTTASLLAPTHITHYIWNYNRK